MRKNRINVEDIDFYFPVVNSSELSTKDTFFINMKAETLAQITFKYKLQCLIGEGIEDFRVYHTTLYGGKKGYDSYKALFYPRRKGLIEAKKKKTIIYWEKTSFNLMPEYDSRLAISKEFLAYLGVVMKNNYCANFDWDKFWKECIGSETRYLVKRSNNESGHSIVPRPFFPDMYSHASKNNYMEIKIEEPNATIEYPGFIVMSPNRMYKQSN